MADKLGDIRRQLKSGVRSQQEARNLAREAAARLNPDAVETRERLDEAFGQIPIADQFRGESEAARQAAIEALDKLEAKPGKPQAKKAAKPRSR